MPARSFSYMDEDAYSFDLTKVSKQQGRPSRFGLQRYARDPLKLSKRAQQLIRFDNVTATIIETHIDDSTPAVLCHCAAIAPRPTGTA